MEVWAVVFLVIEHKAVNTDQEIKGFERNTASEAQKISSYVSFLFFFSLSLHHPPFVSCISKLHFDVHAIFHSCTTAVF